MDDTRLRTLFGLRRARSDSEIPEGASTCTSEQPIQYSTAATWLLRTVVGNDGSLAPPRSEESNVVAASLQTVSTVEAEIPRILKRNLAEGARSCCNRLSELSPSLTRGLRVNPGLGPNTAR